ncbi:ABC transporter permease [Aurantimonas endophytica]|uniref:Peptide/nickel transport system permease protein n=1 Tax=Aurantimonas endophytica TaxID=1522175 RepID=A0A7W6HEY8_9HYPH|nr:ABC transporter permease [Aurantimonas endophytica]MBB4003911.1 peptide/nickel transport system permease protein [Aurantimonas endophytica]MCO6404762.1 ABC transporter permease subunit [Aurantimonas endophytica]
MSAVVPATRTRRAAPGWRLAVGGAIVAALIAVALLSLVWTPAVPTRLDIAARLRPPLEGGLLGTDQLGRDVLSLLMAGAVNSLVIAVAAVAIGASLGTLLGLVAASRRGWIGAMVMRAMDVVFAFPPILSAMMLAALLGTGMINAIVAIAVFMVPVFARITRGAAMRILARDYILAARGAGKSGPRIAIEHVVPNISGDLIVQATIQLGLAILTEAGLSFLGLGLAPPAPSWGRMLADSQTYLATAPWLAIAPGAAIAIAVLGLNLLGDGMRDRLDPRRDLGR